MIPNRTILLALLALPALAAAQDKAAADLFPLEVGRYWGYRQSVEHQLVLGRTEEWTAVRMVLRKTEIRLRTPLGEEGVPKEAFVLRTYPDGQKEHYAVLDGAWVQVCEKRVDAKGASFYSPVYTYPRTMEAAKEHRQKLRPTTAVVPHGSFEGILWTTGDAPERESILVPGIGIVSEEDIPHPLACSPRVQTGPRKLAATGTVDLKQDPEALVAELRQEDPLRSSRALLTLVARGEDSLPALRTLMIGRLREGRFKELLEALNHDEAATRDKALSELRSVLPLTLPQIRTALDQKLPPEVEARLKSLLEEADALQSSRSPSPTRLTRRSAIDAVALIETAAADTLLSEIAEQSPFRPERLEALLALGRRSPALSKKAEWNAKVKANLEVTPELKAYRESRTRWRAATTARDIELWFAAADIVGIAKSATTGGLGASVRISFRIETLFKGGPKDVSVDKPFWVGVDFPIQEIAYAMDRDDEYILFLSSKGAQSGPGITAPLHARISEGEGIVMADEEALKAVRAAAKKASK
jgi:hypothetical protein